MNDLASFLRKGFVLQRDGSLSPPVIRKEANVPPPKQNAPQIKPGTRDATCIRLTLPYPVSVNRLYGYCPKTGRRFMYQEGKDYVHSVKVIGLGQTPFTGDVSLTMRAYRPRKAGDVSNLSKVLDDALEGITYVNDKQIAEHHSYRLDDKDNPRVEVEVRPL